MSIVWGTRIIKKALRRDAGYPFGVAATMHVVCDCGEKVSVGTGFKSNEVFVCKCGTKYDGCGYIVDQENL